MKIKKNMDDIKSYGIITPHTEPIEHINSKDKDTFYQIFPYDCTNISKHFLTCISSSYKIQINKFLFYTTQPNEIMVTKHRIDNFPSTSLISSSTECVVVIFPSSASASASASKQCIAIELSKIPEESLIFTYVSFNRKKNQKMQQIIHF